MSNKTKIIVAVLTIVLALNLVGCGLASQSTVDAQATSIAKMNDKLDSIANKPAIATPTEIVFPTPVVVQVDPNALATSIAPKTPVPTVTPDCSVKSGDLTLAQQNFCFQQLYPTFTATPTATVPPPAQLQQAPPQVNTTQPVTPTVPAPNVSCDPADHVMLNGDIYLVTTNHRAKGDISVSSSKDGPWTQLYDDKADTGLIVDFTQDTWVYAQWGANITCRTTEDLKTEMETSGCENNAGCREVNIKTWPKVMTPTVTPTVPAPTATVSTPVSVDMCKGTIQPDQTVLVKAGCRISGDVLVDGIKLFDDDANTGLVVDMKQDGNVTAPWGASVNSDPAETWVKHMTISGCVGQCTNVKVVSWPQ